MNAFDTALDIINMVDEFVIISYFNLHQLSKIHSINNINFNKRIYCIGDMKVL